MGPRQLELPPNGSVLDCRLVVDARFHPIGLKHVGVIAVEARARAYRRAKNHSVPIQHIQWHFESDRRVTSERNGEPSLLISASICTPSWAVLHEPLHTPFESRQWSTIIWLPGFHREKRSIGPTIGAHPLGEAAAPSEFNTS